jgi:hypothetical protein
VRYYVNTKEHTLCREVLESDDPALLLEEPVPQTDITPDGHAVFEDVRQLLIYHREWRSETKQFLPLLTDTVEHPTPQKATHLLVKLVLRDRYAEERRKYDPARGPSWESAYPTFVKVIPIPECFR